MATINLKLKSYEDLQFEIMRLTIENYLKQQKIDKAIEFYKANQQECVIGRNKDDKLIKDYYLPARASKIMLEILQGDDKE